MKRVAVDVGHLADLLAESLRLVTVDLTPLDVECAWPVFKATAIGCEPMFVKVTEPDAARRALAFLSAAERPFLPRPVLPEALEFGGHSVLCLEWKSAARVNAEDMTDGQLRSFLDGCISLSEALAAYRGPVAPLEEEESPRGEYARLNCYSLRHRLAGRVIRPILSVPEDERAYGGRKLVTIHGDLQPKNYGFDGDRFAAVFDTDDLTQGLACEDAAYAFTERARRSELTPQKRERLAALFRRMVEMSPWPADEWRIAVNHARLRIAARRLANHPDSFFIAFDIRRRDAPLLHLLESLRGL
ncbi:MAG: phosphotransferase [Kiritimatiellae bacterium]|nr:phosphotransferase [Kiritimatiellia bacterium]